MTGLLTYISLVLLSLMSFIPPGNQNGSVVVIVHKSVNVGASELLDSKRLLNIYTLNELTWDDGSRIFIADFKGETAIRKAFYDHLDMNTNAMKKIWLRAQFTGKSTPPAIVDSEDEMIQKVLERPGMIGYVSASKVPENAKVIAKISK